MKKKRYIPEGTKFSAKKDSKILSVKTTKSISVIDAPRVDYNNPRTNKFVPVLRIIIDKIPHFVGLKNTNKVFATTKTPPKLASYKYMSYETRSIVLQWIKCMGAAPSKHVAYAMGYLNTRQVGQIRRWHIKDWRTYTNK